ncbi:hypothetical protein SAMN04488107_1103 [Geodermatophilus saharensis]|uniref:Uncharacterized protein n=1 Tax=Geodermatophilus saharensis TaxID=1137994 RepID=A0A239BD22_9ACTN|nr:hypothetical protein [Geodermatophilus saharensis]SNS05850.1 hypothetical protein SAMN04488107_1103 [Geodermatophilus saharensis]
MTQPPQDGTPPDRTREARLPPVPGRPPAPGRPAVPDQPTDRLAGGPPDQRDPTLRLGGPAAPGPQPPPYGQQPPWGQAPYGHQPGHRPPYGQQPPWGQQPPYGAPGYGAPGYGAPGYGAPGHGAPGYGPPQPPRRSRGPLIALLAALGVLLVGGGVLAVLLLNRDDGGTGAAPASTSATASSSAPTSSSAPSSPAGPTGGGGFGGGAGTPTGGGGGGAGAGELNLPESPEFAAAWVQAVVNRDGETARADLCADGQAQLPDAAALLADFDAFLGGQITEGTATGAAPAGDVDEVTFDVTLDDGSQASFVVTVVDEGGPAVCGYTEA